MRGRGVPKRDGDAGDLLVTVKVAVPQKLDDTATESLQTYVEAEKASGFDPRCGMGRCVMDRPAQAPIRRRSSGSDPDAAVLRHLGGGASWRACMPRRCVPTTGSAW